MSTDEEQALSHRLHGLVANPPPGRNLMPGIRKAAHRRRTRVAAVSSSLGVAGVVVAGAATASLRTGGPSAAGLAASPSSPVLPTAEPSAAAPSVAAPSVAPTTVAPPSDKTGDAGPVPAHVTVSPQADTATVMRGTPYYYQRTMTESDGQRAYRSEWTGRAGDSRIEMPGLAADSDPQSISVATDFRGENGQLVAWDEFSSKPSPARLHTMLYGTTPASAAVLNRLAFKQVHDLLYATPTTATFRLAVVKAVEAIPGVTVRHGVTDEIGRPGERLTLGGAGYVVDPSDGRLLQEDFSAGCATTVLLDGGAVPASTDVLPEVAATPTGAPANCS